MSKGFIALHRSIQNHWIFDDAERLRAWLIMLMTVNHKENKTLIKGKLLACPRGESLLSHSSWATKFGKGWNRQKVIRFFKLLESDSMIEQVNEQVTTRVIINNYAGYQDLHNLKRTPNETVNDTADGHQADTKRTGDDTQLNHDNHVNNDIRVAKAPKKNTRFTPPTVGQVAEYCQERSNSVNPQKFVDFYQTNNWMRGKNKIKDWKACVRTWEQNSQQNGTAGRQW